MSKGSKRMATSHGKTMWSKSVQAVSTAGAKVLGQTQKPAPASSSGKEGQVVV